MIKTIVMPTYVPDGATHYEVEFYSKEFGVVFEDLTWWKLENGQSWYLHNGTDGKWYPAVEDQQALLKRIKTIIEVKDD